MRFLGLSSSLQRDTYSLRRVVGLVALFLFVISFAFSFIVRIGENREIYDAQTSYIVDDIHLLAASLDVLDYQTVAHLAADILDHELVIGLKVEDRYDYVLFNELPDAGELNNAEVQLVNIGEGRDLVASSPGRATVVFEPYQVSQSLLTIFLFSAALALTTIIPVSTVLVVTLNRYIGTPLQLLNNAIKNCIESGTFARMEYSPNTAFGDFAERFNEMQERLEAEVTRSTMLSERNQKGRLRAEKMAAELRIERDQRDAEALLIGDLLSANNQLVVYRTNDRRIKSNLDRFPHLTQPAILYFLAQPCFERDQFERRMTNLSDKVQQLEMISEKSSPEILNASYVIETVDGSFWNAELITIKDRLDAVVFSDRTEVYLSERNKSQDEKLRALGQLTSGVAHDFNNILGIISLATQSLRLAIADHSTSKSELSEDIEIIKNGSERAAGIVSHLLAFSRDKRLEKELIGLKPFFAEARTVLKALLQANIELELDIEDGLFISANRDLLQTCVMNFASNARHAMPHGGKFVIRASRRNTSNVAKLVDNEAGYVAIEFTDNGIGMDKDTAARIFEPFFTTKAPGKGTGLGLSMAYGLATDLKGSLTCRSKPNKGTTMLLVLPLSNQSSDASAPERIVSQEKSTSIANLLRGTSIVLVDDEAVLRKITKRGLESHGAQVLDFASVTELQENVQQLPKKIDVVISDNLLEDGWSGDVVNVIRDSGLAAPVLVITGHETAALAELVAGGDVVKVLEKPFALSNLVAQVQAASGQPQKMHG